MIKPPTIRYPLAASCPKMVVSQFEPPKKSTNWLVDLNPALLKLMAQNLCSTQISINISFFWWGICFVGHTVYIFSWRILRLVWWNPQRTPPWDVWCEHRWLSRRHAVEISITQQKAKKCPPKKEIHQGLLGAPTDWWYPEICLTWIMSLDRKTQSTPSKTQNYPTPPCRFDVADDNQQKRTQQKNLQLLMRKNFY